MLVIISHILFSIAALGCETFELDFGRGYYKEKGGYWTYKDRETDECESFSELGGDPDWDAAWKVGRAASVIGSIVSYVMLIMLLVNSCVRYPKVLFKIMAGCMFFMSIMSGLLLVGLASNTHQDIFYQDSDIEMSTGAIMAIIAFFLWIVTGASMFFCMKERNIQSRPMQASAVPAVPMYSKQQVSPAYQQSYPPTKVVPPMQPAMPRNVQQDSTTVEEVEIVEHPDGRRTKTTTTTTTLPDGTKEIVKSEEEL